MFELLLQPEIQKFIRDHEGDDTTAMLLKTKEVLGISMQAVVQQIVAREKAKTKLPLFYNSSSIVYPPSINLEQSSSEKTSLNKIDILKHEIVSSRNAVDLTGGFGVDSFFLSKLFQRIQHVEPDNDLLEITRHNHKQLGATNVEYFNTTAEQFLNATSAFFDLIFVDPSRRIDKSKVVSLRQSEPDAVSLKEKIFEHTSLFLVKASPMLDIKTGINELRNVKKTFVVAVDNEVKELLFLCEKNFESEPEIVAQNFTDSANEVFNFKIQDEVVLKISTASPDNYLYEPNAAIMKAGAFKLLTAKYPVQKIAVSTHLYTSNVLVPNFPGRIFKIEAHIKPDNAVAFFPNQKANVTTRNYPLSVEELKKRSKLKDGGDKFLFGFSGQDKKFLVVASRIK